MFNKDKTCLIQYPKSFQYYSYFISDSVTEIGELAFADCLFLKEIIIPDSVIKIGDSAFVGCISLKKIYAPKDLDLSKTDYPKGCGIIRY